MFSNLNGWEIVGARAARAVHLRARAAAQGDQRRRADAAQPARHGPQRDQRPQPRAGHRGQARGPAPEDVHPQAPALARRTRRRCAGRSTTRTSRSSGSPTTSTSTTGRRPASHRAPPEQRRHDLQGSDQPPSTARVRARRTGPAYASSNYTARPWRGRVRAHAPYGHGPDRPRHAADGSTTTPPERPVAVRSRHVRRSRTVGAQAERTCRPGSPGVRRAGRRSRCSATAAGASGRRARSACRRRRTPAPGCRAGSGRAAAPRRPTIRDSVAGDRRPAAGAEDLHPLAGRAAPARTCSRRRRPGAGGSAARSRRPARPPRPRRPAAWSPR